jgi:hypothetical protein
MKRVAGRSNAGQMSAGVSKERQHSADNTIPASHVWMGLTECETGSKHLFALECTVCCPGGVREGRVRSEAKRGVKEPTQLENQRGNNAIPLTHTLHPKSTSPDSDVYLRLEMPSRGGLLSSYSAIVFLRFICTAATSSSAPSFLSFRRPASVTYGGLLLAASGTPCHQQERRKRKSGERV